MTAPAGRNKMYNLLEGNDKKAKIAICMSPDYWKNRHFDMLKKFNDFCLTPPDQKSYGADFEP